MPSPSVKPQGSQHCKKLPQNAFAELEDVLPSLRKGSEGMSGS